MMQPHQQRIVEERNELATKLGNLQEFTQTNQKFTTLPHIDKELLKAQEALMMAYLKVLNRRIARFTD